MSNNEHDRFINPYAGRDDVSRITTDVSIPDYMLIKQIRPGSGTITGVLGILWQKLCNELRDRQITDFTQCDQFEQIVVKCRLIPDDEYERLATEAAQWCQHQASTGHLSDGSAARRNVRGPIKGSKRRTAKSLGDPNPAGPPEPSDVPVSG